MAAALLASKLYVPPPPPRAVVRPRLVERLNAGLHHRLALVCAPAGFGKTTLVSEWVAQCGQPAGWLSLDEGDNDLQRFLAYLATALQAAAAGLGNSVLAALQSPQMPATELLLTLLLNEIAAAPGHFILVLEDYHVVHAQPVHAALAYLVEHLPPQLQLVVASREDPPLPLARLRARGQLTEVRAADLRFTPAEAAEFLNRAASLGLAADDIAALEKRTEGWIAGLQLAAIALQAQRAQIGEADAAGFIHAFSGSHRFVLDYLIEEVLRGQPEDTRSFLLHTSVLDRLCGPLCEWVAGQKDSQRMLEALERGNLFLVPLDDQRQWYRYHHLFAGALQARLQQEGPEQAAGLHRRASEWFAQNGFPHDAIRHALAAQDFERAASLLELAWSSMDSSYQSATWLGWAKQLPGQVVQTRPALSLGYAWALLDAGELESCEAYLQNAEAWLENPDREINAGQKMVVDDKALFQSLPAAIATAQAYRSLALGDIPGAVACARRALDLTADGDWVRQIQSTALLGIAQYASGDLEAASRSYTEFQARLLQAGDTTTAVGITFVLANIRQAQGRLRQAIETYRQALKLVGDSGDAALGTADLYRGLGELWCEQGDLQAAREALLAAKKLGEQAAMTDWQHRLHVSEARLQEAQGRLDEALHSLDEAERWYVRSPLPDVRPISALRARIWIRQGELAKAEDWARQQNLRPDQAIHFLQEFELITLARLLIARHSSEPDGAMFYQAEQLLERLMNAAEAGGRVGSLIELLILRALLQQAHGLRNLALAQLAQALGVAGSEGYVQIFLDEGQPMLELLERLKAEAGKKPAQEYSLEYLHRLLRAFGKPAEMDGAPGAHQPLPEPLSERELEVLRLLRTELSGPEIARQLVVTLNTLRTHTKNIYTKLGVDNRRAAVRRAEELDLV